MKITAMTCLCADLFHASGEIRPGGEALNFASNAQRYSSIEPAVIGAVGDDSCGKAVTELVMNSRIDKRGFHVIKGGITASNVTYLTEQGDRYYKPDSWTNGVFLDFTLSDSDKELMKHSDIIHTTYSCPLFTQIARLKTEYGYKLSVDLNCERRTAELDRAASYADFFFVSGADGNTTLEMLRDEKSYPPLLKLIKLFSEKYNGIYTATFAEYGSVSFKSGKYYFCPAERITDVVDTTGCGDSYQSGFVCTYALTGDIAKSMKAGSEAAADILSRYGGVYTV